MHCGRIRCQHRADQAHYGGMFGCCLCNVAHAQRHVRIQELSTGSCEGGIGCSRQSSMGTCSCRVLPLHLSSHSWHVVLFLTTMRAHIAVGPVCEAQEPANACYMALRPRATCFDHAQPHECGADHFLRDRDPLRHRLTAGTLTSLFVMNCAI